MDVHKRSEYSSEHVMGAVNVPLDYIDEYIGEVDRSRPVFVHCAGAYKSVIFCSNLRTRGFRNLINAECGFKAIKESGQFKLTDFEEQSTEL